MRMTRFGVPIAIVGALIVLGGLTAGLIWARDQAPPAAPPQPTAAAADNAVVPESPKQPSNDLSGSGQAALQPDPAVPMSGVAKPRDAVVMKGTGNGVIQKQTQHGQTASQERRPALGNEPADKAPAAKSGDDENQAPLLPDKVELRYPNLGSSLDQLVAGVESGQTTPAGAAADTPVHSGESVAVTIHLSGNVADMVAYLEANGADPRNVGEDYVEAYVPVTLLGRLSERPGVLRVREIIPPEPGRGG